MPFLTRQYLEGCKKRLFIDKEQLMTCKIPPFQGWGWGLGAGVRLGAGGSGSKLGGGGKGVGGGGVGFLRVARSKEER